MKLDISQSQAFTHGEAYHACLAQRAASKSKTAKTPLDLWQWRYDWCQIIESSSLFSLPKKESCEQRIARRIANSKVSLVLTYKSCWYSTPLNDVPEPVREHIRKQEEANAAEQKRVESLSPAERQAELESALRQLASPGFVAVGSPSSPAIKTAKKAGVRVIPLR